MKVGILTFHRAINYGALLQCYSLQEIMKKFGHDVFVINYAQKYIEAKSTKKISFKECIKSFILFWKLPSYFRSFRYIKKRANVSREFQKNFNLTRMIFDKDNIPNDFDVYIVGSDQVWSTVYTGKKDLDPIYGGNFFHKDNAKIIGYAISMNKKSLEIIPKEKLKTAGSRFSKLSFREKIIRDSFQKITGIKAQICLDPTLLTEEDMWDKFITENNKYSDYIFVYEVRQLDNNKKLLSNAAKLMAKKLNCQIINASQYKTKSVYTVNDFLSLIKHARCIITSSFHACAFSIIFRKPFYAYCLDDGHDERYVNLLYSLGLKKLLLTPDDLPTDVPNIDYEQVHSKLELLKLESLKYLQNI